MEYQIKGDEQDTGFSFLVIFKPLPVKKKSILVHVAPSPFEMTENGRPNKIFYQVLKSS